MSLRKSPTLTPALLASNRRNAKKSTGPRTARGKAIARLNSFRHGMRSPEYVNFLKALYDAPLGEMGRTAQALLASKEVIHPLFVERAQACVQADIEICKERLCERLRRICNDLHARSRNLSENKSRGKKRLLNILVC